MSVGLPVRPLGRTQPTTGRIFMKFNILKIFGNLAGKFKFD
jgi:hypothetical protein